MTDKYQCTFCNADSGRVLLRRPAASICDKCVIVLVDDIGKEATSEYVRGLVGEVVKLTLALKRLKAPPPAPEPRRAEPEPEPRGVVPDGPWSYRLWTHRDRWQEASIRAAECDGRPGTNLATVLGGGPDATSRADLDIEATARLIAAAPVMLEALRSVRSCEEELSVYGLRTIDKAIEAATGEKPT